MSFLRAQRGNGLIYGALGTLLLLLVVGGVYDVYTGYHLRTWAYQVTGEAARYGTTQGVTLNPFTGELTVAPLMAQTAANSFLAVALDRQRAISGVHWEARVITAATGGSVPGFPPVPRANLDGGDMRLTGPGVGVYLTFSYPTAWLGVIARSQMNVHAFSAAQVTELR